MADMDFRDPYLIGGEDERWRTQPYRPPTSPTTTATSPPAIPPSNYGSGAMDQLVNMYNQQRRAQGFADLGSVFGGLAEGERANRSAGGSREYDFDRMMLEREAEMNRLRLLSEQDRRASEADAFKKLGSTSYLLSGGASQLRPPQVSIRGQMLDLPTGTLPTPGEGELAGARTLQAQMLDRLQPGVGWQPSFDYVPRPFNERDSGPSTLERIGNIGALATGGLGVLDTLTGGRGLETVGRGLGNVGRGIGGLLGLSGGPSSTASMIPGTNILTVAGTGGTGIVPPPGMGSSGGGIANFLGKAAPIAGAALGTYGLLRDRGTLSNIASGASAGAGYGSMIAPGVGTLVGGGIGALVGALRGIGGPSGREIEGRQEASQIRQQISSAATPDQLARARAAGGQLGPMEHALAYTVLSDQFGSERASQIMDQLWKAEKGGRSAVQQVYGAVR